MKINFNVNVKSLKGGVVLEDGVPLTLATLISNQLVVKSEGIEPLKAYEWAQKIYGGNELEIDSTDYDKLYLYIEKHEGLTNLAIAQLLIIMREAKED